jgi:hypothetical protein
MGTPLYILRKTLADFPKLPFLKADAGKTTAFRARLAALGPGPYVGIGWRSMVMGAKRGKYFSPVDAWGPVLTTPGVTFVNGNMAMSPPSWRGARQVRHHHPQFRRSQSQDDLMGGRSRRLRPCHSRPRPWRRWPALGCRPGSAARLAQLGTDHYPWYRSTRVFVCEKFADWANLMPKVRSALEKFSPTDS